MLPYMSQGYMYMELYTEWGHGVIQGWTDPEKNQIIDKTPLGYELKCLWFSIST